MMKMIISALALMMNMAPASAQQMIDPGAQDVGASVTLVTKYRRSTTTYLGQDGDLFRYERVSKGAGPDFVDIFWRDGAGQATRMTYENVEQLYEPHDCRLTVGRCVYTRTYINEKLNEKTQKQYIRVTSFENGVWVSKQYLNNEAPENLKTESTFSVDEFGHVIESESLIHHKDYSKPKRGWAKRLK